MQSVAISRFQGNGFDQIFILLWMLVQRGQVTTRDGASWYERFLPNIIFGTKSQRTLIVIYKMNSKTQNTLKNGLIDIFRPFLIT